MTSAKPTTTKAPGRFPLPDPPEREPDDMTRFDRLAENGNAYLLKQHLLARQPGAADNIIVSGEHSLVAEPTPNLEGSRYPHLLVAFDADLEARRASNGYVIAEQGKPPDFALEIASRSTGHIDTGQKRTDYAGLGILEYWRFDDTGEHHGTKLAGEHLVDGTYVAIQIEELPDGNLQGYSTVLDLYLRWERGQLVFCNPDTGQHIATLEVQPESQLTGFRTTPIRRIALSYCVFAYGNRFMNPLMQRCSTQGKSRFGESRGFPAVL